MSVGGEAPAASATCFAIATEVSDNSVGKTRKDTVMGGADGRELPSGDEACKAASTRHKRCKKNRSQKRQRCKTDDGMPNAHADP